MNLLFLPINEYIRNQSIGTFIFSKTKRFLSLGFRIEPLCHPHSSRRLMFPIRHGALWEMYARLIFTLISVYKTVYGFRYKRQTASYWTTEEVNSTIGVNLNNARSKVDLSIDIDDWKTKLTDNERYFIQVRRRKFK
jgi:hypothetical protein